LSTLSRYATRYEDISFHILHEARLKGGAVYISSSSNACETCEFTRNIAQTRGGAVWIMSTTNFEQCSFHVANKGGTCFSSLFDGLVMFDKCNFNRNVAWIEGGAIYSSKTSTTLKNSNFNENTSQNRGGAVFLNESREVFSCNLTNNKANQGGCFYVLRNGTISNSTKFLNNNSTSSEESLFKPVVSLATLSL
jgi:hypothetical protein